MNQDTDPLASSVVAEEMFTVNLTQEQIDFFWSRIHKTDECWIWFGARQPRGYGNLIFKHDGKNIYITAHRLSYFIHFGPFPKKLSILHRCDNPSCVNPDHLWIGTIKDNNADCLQKGRHGPSRNPACMQRGEGASFSKLKEEDVRFILKHPEFKYGERKALAEKLGVTTGLIDAVRQRRIWKHITA